MKAIYLLKETYNLSWEKEANKISCLVKEGLWNMK